MCGAQVLLFFFFFFAASQMIPTQPRLRTTAVGQGGSLYQFTEIGNVLPLIPDDDIHL